MNLCFTLNTDSQINIPIKNEKIIIKNELKIFFILNINKIKIDDPWN